MTLPPDIIADTDCDCSEALVLLQDYLKQELSSDLVARVEAHLQRCRACFRHRCFEERFIAMLAERARGVLAPDEVRARVLAALEAEQARA